MSAAAERPAEAPATLELALDPADATRLPRLPELARLRAGRARTTPIRLVWYDTPEAALAAEGVSLCEQRLGPAACWRLERLRGTAAMPWLPGTPAPLLGEAARRGDLGRPLPTPLLAVAACEGVLRALPLRAEAGSLGVTMLEATLRAVAGERAVCRVHLIGAPAVLEPLAFALAAPLRLSVPPAALAAEAYAVAGRNVPPPALGAPELPPDVAVGEAFARVVGHLAAVLLHWAPLALDGTTPEAVHQMRVALRRLRSAVSLFRRGVGGPELDAAMADLRALGHVLGPARDWDVFLAGTGRAVGEAFADDRSVVRLLAAAEQRRQHAYAALRAVLAGPSFRRLGLRLALLATFRPWLRAAPAAAELADAEAERRAATLALPLGAFAAQALSRRLAHVLEPADDLADLPPEALHALRIQGKRLRYAAEFFAPLYPRRETRRFLRRVSALQERLGHLNDGSVAAALMAQLGGAGPERSHAVGIVRGFVAAGMRRSRAKLERSWRKFRRLEPFWG